MVNPGITVQCVHCKARKTLTLDEARALGELGPMCSGCFMPMVVVSAWLKSRRSKKDLREVFK